MHIDIEDFANVMARVLPWSNPMLSANKAEMHLEGHCEALKSVVVGSYFKIILSNILRC